MTTCPSCGATNAAGSRFCSRCGSALPAMADSTGRICNRCGASLEPAHRFCPVCGAVAEAGGPPSRSAATHSGGSLMALLRSIGEERTGIAAAVTVFALAAVLSWIAWYPVSAPSRIVNALVPGKTCVDEVPGSTGMYICSAQVAVLTLVGPFATLAMILLLRGRVVALVGALTPKMPEGSRFVVAPLVATTLFLIPWAGVHYDTSNLEGILPQKVFPAVIGLFAYAAARYGPAVQRSIASFFDARDHLPGFMRLALAVLIPAGIALLITRQDRVTDTALKEQFIVLISLFAGYLALAPRSGNLASGARQLLGRDRGAVSRSG